MNKRGEPNADCPHGSSSKWNGRRCMPCYQAQRRQNLEATRIERFWARVNLVEGDGCWEWMAARSSKGGYGNTYFDGRYQRASRVAYELTTAPIPDGMHVLHRCDNPPCVRPDHLFLGTPADNTRDMVQKGRHRGGTLSPQEVAAIRSASGTVVEIGKKFGRSGTTISRIKRWIFYRHEDDELWQKRQELLDSLPPLSNGRKPR